MPIKGLVPNREVLQNLIGLALIVALLAIGAGYALDAMSRHQRETAGKKAPESFVSANISGVALTLPKSALSSADQSNTDFSDRIDMKIALDLGDATPETVGLTLVPKARARASAALLDSVYLQHFSPEEKRGISGLIGKPLIGSDGYGGETVWYDPLQADPFVAKCAPPLGEESTGQCLRTLVLDSGLSAVLGFSDTALIHWRQIDTPLAAFLDRIGAGKPIR